MFRSVLGTIIAGFTRKRNPSMFCSFSYYSAEIPRHSGVDQGLAASPKRISHPRLVTPRIPSLLPHTAGCVSVWLLDTTHLFKVERIFDTSLQAIFRMVASLLTHVRIFAMLSRQFLIMRHNGWIDQRYPVSQWLRGRATIPRPPVYETGELPAAPPRDIEVDIASLYARNSTKSNL